MASFSHDPDTWGINLKEYERLGWGSAVGSFKVPNSVIKRFRKNVYILNSDGSIHDTLPSGGTIGDQSNQYKLKNIFDVDKALYEMATTYINAIVSMFYILRQTPFYMFEGGMTLDVNHNVTKAPIKGSDQDMLRNVVFNAMEYCVLNRQVWENVNGSSISTPNFNINITQTNWLLTKDMVGRKASNILDILELDQYEWILEPTKFLQTKNGNFKILGKAKIEDIPEIVNK